MIKCVIINDMAGCREKRKVDGNKITLFKYGIDTISAFIVMIKKRKGTLRKIRYIISYDSHTECLCSLRNFLSDGTEAQNTERFSVEILIADAHPLILSEHIPMMILFIHLDLTAFSCVKKHLKDHIFSNRHTHNATAVCQCDSSSLDLFTVSCIISCTCSLKPF